MNIRLYAVILSTCGLLLAGTTTEAAAAPLVDPGTAPVRIVTYNMEYGRTPATVVDDINRIADMGADVIGLQEMGSLDRRAAVLDQVVDCSSCIYDAFMPDTREQNAVPILYRWSKFRLIDSGGTKVSERTFVGAGGAGPSTLKAKWVNWVLLRHRVTGQNMYVLNNHAVPSVQNSKGTRDLSYPERLELYRQHMEGLKTMITGFTATGAAVFSTGDFNVNYRSDSVKQDTIFPYFNMSAVNVEASFTALGMPEMGTHTGGSGTRLIDYVFALKHPAVAAKAQTILTGFTSDHRPLLVRYAIDK